MTGEGVKGNNRTIVTRLVRVTHARIFSSFSRFRFTRDEMKRSFPRPKKRTDVSIKCFKENRENSNLSEIKDANC